MSGQQGNTNRQLERPERHGQSAAQLESPMNTLQGRTALVTGAASGIGRASALLFAAEGAAVVALDRAAEVEATASAIRSAGGRAVALIRDSSADEDVAGAVAFAVKEYGGLDVCFANAGISGGLVPFFEETVERWTEVLRINLIGTFLAAKHAALAMVPKGRGSIICTASVAGLRSGAGGLPYSASKAGVISLVQTAANQLAGSGVRVNAICPGLIETGMTRPIFEQARARGNERKIGQLNPLRRPGVPDEIAQTALFLASDASSYVNGQAIAVDGGLSTSHPIVIRRD
jgi:NAD(P)-dependent dehydrogenase (short-subunit alcohol dehydrogenase family)